MKDKLIAIKSTRVLLENEIKAAVIIIENEKIINVCSAVPINFEGTVDDVGDSVLMPGLIDCHVHINEPGRSHWEGFETATKAAAAGGITTLVDMPLNASPVTTTAINFDIKLKSLAGKLHVNCGFWGGIVPDNLNDLKALLDSGVLGLKAFLTHSGIDDFPNATRQHLLEALLLLKKYDLPLLVHCELDAPHEDSYLLEQNPTSYAAYLKSRPKDWENKAVKMVIELCRETKAHVHIVHVSSAEALPLIKQAKADGLPLTAETCPHYLFFDAENIPDGGTVYKCAPPIRERANNELLWEALKEGTLDFIVTDHSPAPPDLKEIKSGNFIKAWGGIAGLQFSLPAIWTAAQKRGFTLNQITKLMSGNIAHFLKLDNKKGKIANGYDADIVIWNPEQKFMVNESMILHLHKITPYVNLNLQGVIEKTYVNGKLTFDHYNFISLNKGKIILNTI